MIPLFMLTTNVTKADGDIEIKGSIQAKTDSSITVNSLEVLITASTKFENEEHSGISFDDLKIGDAVNVEATSNAGGSLVAKEIKLISNKMMMEFQGTISAVSSNSFTVNGKEVFVDSTTSILTQFHASLTFGDLKVGDRVSVKFMNASGGNSVAVLVMVITQNSRKEIETEGKIQVISSNSISVNDYVFTVDSTTIIVGMGKGILKFSDLAEGQDVEVRGYMKSDSTYFALLIKVDSREFSHKDFELEGPIVEINSNSFVVGGVTIFADSSTVIFSRDGSLMTFADLNIGDEVEVKAIMQGDGTYQAVRIKVESEKHRRNIEVEGMISSVNSDNFSVGGYTIYVNSQTKIYSQTNQSLTFADLESGSYVRVQAYPQDNIFYASKIKIRKNENSDVFVTGAIDAIEGSNIKVRGFLFVTDQNTEFVDNNRMTITFNDLKQGQIVSVNATAGSDNQYHAVRVRVNNYWRSSVIVEGTIDSLGANLLKVSDKVFVVDSSTVIFGHGTSIINFLSLTLGLKVEVKGIVDASNNLVAKIIKVHPENEIKVYGEIDSISTNAIFVAGLKINVDNSTVYYDQYDNLTAFDSMQTGQTVEIKYIKTTLNENLAVSVKVEKKRGACEFNGIVTAVTSNHIQLSIPSFSVNATTVFLSSVYSPIASSSIEAGQTVNILAAPDASGNLQAEQVLLLSSSLTSVNSDNEKLLPTEFQLNQNYPNPFNPTTKISFTLSKPSNVTLKVFNIIGQEVATLVNGQMDKGSYDVSFNANGLASGIYFYRLNAGDFTSVKKMLLLK